MLQPYPISYEYVQKKRIFRCFRRQGGKVMESGLTETGTHQVSLLLHPYQDITLSHWQITRIPSFIVTSPIHNRQERLLRLPPIERPRSEPIKLYHFIPDIFFIFSYTISTVIPVMHRISLHLFLKQGAHAAPLCITILPAP